MRSEVRLFLGVVGILVLNGCGPGTAFPPPIPTPGRDWTIHLTQSGGFAGLHLLLDVTSDGTLMAEDRRTGRTATHQVPEATLKELDELLRRATFGRENLPKSGCADCFIYDLEVISGDERVHLMADDTNLAASGAEDLIHYLQSLRDQALATVS